MGLTGMITGARIRMRPIESSRLRVDTLRAEDLDDLIAAMYEADSTHRYSVGVGRHLARGKKLGRSVLTVGDFASADELGKQRSNPGLDPRRRTAPKVPVLTVELAGSTRVVTAPGRRAGRRRGQRPELRLRMPQYQVIVPDGLEDALAREQFAIAVPGVPGSAQVRP